MKSIQAACVAIILTATAISCNNTHSEEVLTGEPEKASVQVGKNYIADTTASIIHWRATHTGGLVARYGTISISSGSIAVDSNRVTGGNFTININSISVDSASVTEKDKKAVNLQNHLKSPDFFDAAKYPDAKFVITAVNLFDSTKHKSLFNGATDMISGNLTIKDKTLNIDFPALIKVEDDKVNVHARFAIDRTSWNLHFGDKGDDPLNWLISKDFELTIDVVAK